MELTTGNLLMTAPRPDVVKLYEIHIFTGAVSGDREEVAHAGEAAFAGELRRDLFGRDRYDRIDFDFSAFNAVPPAGTHTRSHPDAHGAPDRTTSHAVAQV